MIERFFGCDEDEEDDESFAPEVAEGGETFSFGVAPPNNTTPSKSCGMAMQGTPGNVVTGAAGSGNMPAFGSPVRALNFA